MMIALLRANRRMAGLVLSVLAWQVCQTPACANPTVGTASVVQGAANFSSSGSQLTITAANNTFINWQSFNINAGETTTFVQPSSSSLVWNRINDPNPSQILGTLNANGYVVLQNQSGFFIGGSAAISTHGLVMTTTPTPMPDLSSGSAWQFNAPPPTAKIINYGQINITGGGSVFLIASDTDNGVHGIQYDGIQNYGTISAPGGKIGLYAGQQVLVSMSPDGRGLSAKVTLPQGSVDNEGQLIADAGSIAAQAQTVNQNGLIQANSVQNINGVVELVASDSLTLGANSDIEANGDSSAANTSASPGGFVVLHSANTYADTPTSLINVFGQLGGQNGMVEIFGNNLDGTLGNPLDANSVQSSIGNTYATLINPYDITLSANPTDTSSTSPSLNVNDLANYSQIDLHALDNIELSANWFLNDPGAPALLCLQAGNSLILDDGSGINAGNNWSVNLTAGTGFVPTVGQPTLVSGSDGIYLNGSASIQTQNGDINLWAANEVQVATAANDLIGASGIRTMNGGNITVNTEYGDVNAGANPVGFVYHSTAPFYTVAASIGNSLGGISTAAGGNVTINAGGNVFSYLPSGNSAADDGGSGAFGPEAGNVTITAGGSVFGHYVLANGLGSITAGQDVGAANGNPFALSLIAGTWDVNAPNGNIYLQEVRNPNGVFNNLIGRKGVSPGKYLFDYSPQAAVDLTAIGVEFTGADATVPRPYGAVPVIYPPILEISAGAGGVTLDANLTLFPSSYQNLNIITTGGGDLTAAPSLVAPYELIMSDSSQTQWKNATSFSDSDHGSTLIAPNNPNPVGLNISGSMENLNLITSRATQITVGGDMINCGFSGQNLNANDVTSIHVTGQIYNQSAYSFVTLSQAIPSLPAADLPPGLGSSWDAIFTVALDPAAIAALSIPAIIPASQWATYAQQNASLFPLSYINGKLLGDNPGFVYNPATGRFGFGGAMPQSVLSDLMTPTITVLRFGANGLPVTYTGADGKTYFATDQINWVAPSEMQTLFTASQGNPSPSTGQLGYRLGGPGQFNVDAGSISLGNSYGILSCGVNDPQGGFGRYANLAPETPSAATLNVTVAGDLTMLTSTIAAIGKGGDVNVTSTGGSMDLGSQELFNTSRQVGFGIFTSGGGDLNVTAFGDISINGSRISTYNGGDIFIESLEGSVNAGSGGDTFTGVGVSFVNPATGKAGFYAEDVYGSGIVANTLVDPSQVPGSATVPGNITVKTPRGDIIASLGGITQEALNGNISGGPTITLVAGTKPSYVGNVDLGNSGVIGGTVNVTANGNITGLVISRQSSTVQAAENFNGTVLSGGSASVSGGGTVSGTIIGVGGASVSGGSVSAEVLGQNVSVNGGASQSTLGTTATASTAAQSAANQSGNETKQQLANNDSGSDDDNKKKLKPSLSRHIKRVTVILPKT